MDKLLARLATSLDRAEQARARTTEWLLHKQPGTALFASGIVLFGTAYYGSFNYYSHFGLAPADVGLGYERLLARVAVLYAGLAGLLFAAIVLAYLIGGFLLLLERGLAGAVALLFVLAPGAAYLLARAGANQQIAALVSMITVYAGLTAVFRSAFPWFFQRYGKLLGALAAAVLASLVAVALPDEVFVQAPRQAALVMAGQAEGARFLFLDISVGPVGVAPPGDRLVVARLPARRGRRAVRPVRPPGRDGAQDRRGERDRRHPSRVGRLLVAEPPRAWFLSPAAGRARRRPGRSCRGRRGRGAGA